MIWTRVIIDIRWYVMIYQNYLESYRYKIHLEEIGDEWNSTIIMMIHGTATYCDQPEAFEEKPDLENLLSAAWVKYVSKRATAA